MHIFERSFDPLSGLWTTYGAQDGKLVIKHDADVSPNLDFATERRNSDSYSSDGIKKGMWHCVHIPEIVAMKMLTEDGFDVYKENARDVRKFLSRNKEKYGYLFTTGGKF